MKIYPRLYDVTVIICIILIIVASVMLMSR